MAKLNFESYFESIDTQYCDSKYIITILENILKKKLDDIKNEINNTQIIVTKEQITAYLEKKFEEEDSELKKRIESSKPKRPKNNTSWTGEDIKVASQEFMDRLSAERYYFEPYALEYFNRYANILRNKALLLVNIIEKIGYKNSLSIQDLLNELDIQLDQYGNILKEDIIRLITPTIYNIRELNNTVANANLLSTYLTFKLSKNSLYRDGWSEEEIYPTSSLQSKNLYYSHREGNVDLSDNQRAELKREQRRSMKKNAKILLDL